MDIKDVLLEYYKINYDYQNVKERMYWLATTLYLGFGAGSIIWITANTSIVLRLQGWILSFCIGAFAFAECFVFLQNWFKARAVFADNALLNLLRRFDPGMKRPQHWEICKAMQSGPGTKGFNPVTVFFRNGWTGAVAMGVMLLFFLVQTACIFLPHLFRPMRLFH
jgi:hypothetical protein